MDVETFYDGSTAMIRFPDGGVMRLADAQRQISPDLEFDDISGLPLASTPTPYDPSQSVSASAPNRFGDVGSTYGNESLQAAGDMLSNKVNLYDALPSSMQGGVMEPVNRTIMNAATLGAGGLMGLLGLFEKGVGYGSEIVAGGTEAEKRLARDVLGGSEVAGIGPEARALAALSSPASQQVSRAALDRLNQPGPVPTMYSNPLGGRVVYRGDTGSNQRITGGISEGNLFVSPHEDVAKLYGDKISEFTLPDTARVLVEGTPEFAKVTGRRRGPLLRTMRQGENLVQASTDAVNAAKSAGYDAVEFNSMRDLGISIINPDILTSKATQPGLLSIPEQTAKPKTSAAELRRQANIQRFGYDPSAVPEAPAPQGISEGFQAYLNQVNPDARRIPPENRPNLMMGDMYGMLPAVSYTHLTLPTKRIV